MGAPSKQRLAMAAPSYGGPLAMAGRHRFFLSIDQKRSILWFAVLFPYIKLLSASHLLNKCRPVSIRLQS